MTRTAPDGAVVAVFDVGKTNVKLNAVSTDGTVLEALSTPNDVHPGPPFRHHDLPRLEAWLLAGLAELAGRHRLGWVVTSGHGSGGVLVDDTGPVLPMIDYEQPLPEDFQDEYRAAAGPFFDRGSAVMMAATHQARQLMWFEREFPDEVARARWLLGVPQYWAFRLSGVAAAEYSLLGAQSHLWNVPEHCNAAIVAARGWERLMPPIAPAWASLGPVRADLAARWNLPPDLSILCGVHDSSANFYRYKAAGLDGLTLLSTGTWIVGLRRTDDLSLVSEVRGMTLNADLAGRPVAGALTMGGREFALVAGDGAALKRADPALVAALVARGTFAVPSFGSEDGLFPGSGGRGRIEGPPPETPEERRALATLYTALLADVCLSALQAEGQVVLDGSFVRDPLFASLVAALRPGKPMLYSLDADGVAAGAALLATHTARTAPVEIPLETPAPLDLPALAAYRARWLALAEAGDRSPAGGHAAGAPHSNTKNA
ncbi:FGGY family carbohydrate kinase [Methylobrevis albus]|uniref:Carbohydrate kinase n=1 Tax=Methylobrevis albus TaxID=2793297 RepID=A0A931I0I1_9HYPH|nr:FGGY family carbohydrate kinase [Methylobrevis albus]MBH0238097.1 carbohydrate kinase [Methylobrevis albus]